MKESQVHDNSQIARESVVDFLLMIGWKFYSTPKPEFYFTIPDPNKALGVALRSSSYDTQEEMVSHAIGTFVHFGESNQAFAENSNRIATQIMLRRLAAEQMSDDLLNRAARKVIEMVK